MWVLLQKWIDLLIVGGRDITIIRMYFQNVAQKIVKICILAKSFA